MEKKVLHLSVSKQWFDLISSGEKKEEYREIKDYWTIRLFDVSPFYTGVGPPYWSYRFAKMKYVTLENED